MTLPNQYPQKNSPIDFINGLSILARYGASFYASMLFWNEASKRVGILQNPWLNIGLTLATTYAGANLLKILPPFSLIAKAKDNGKSSFVFIDTTGVRALDGNNQPLVNNPFKNSVVTVSDADLPAAYKEERDFYRSQNKAKPALDWRQIAKVAAEARLHPTEHIYSGLPAWLRTSVKFGEVLGEMRNAAYPTDLKIRGPIKKTWWNSRGFLNAVRFYQGKFGSYGGMATKDAVETIFGPRGGDTSRQEFYTDNRGRVVGFLHENATGQIAAGIWTNDKDTLEIIATDIANRAPNKVVDLTEAGQRVMRLFGRGSLSNMVFNKIFSKGGPAQDLLIDGRQGNVLRQLNGRPRAYFGKTAPERWVDRTFVSKSAERGAVGVQNKNCLNNIEEVIYVGSPQTVFSTNNPTRPIALNEHQDYKYLVQDTSTFLMLGFGLTQEQFTSERVSRKKLKGAPQQQDTSLATNGRIRLTSAQAAARRVALTKKPADDEQALINAGGFAGAQAVLEDLLLNIQHKLEEGKYLYQLKDVIDAYQTAITFLCINDSAYSENLNPQFEKEKNELKTVLANMYYLKRLVGENYLLWTPYNLNTSIADMGNVIGYHLDAAENVDQKFRKDNSQLHKINLLNKKIEVFNAKRMKKNKSTRKLIDLPSVRINDHDYKYIRNNAAVFDFQKKPDVLQYITMMVKDIEMCRNQAARSNWYGVMCENFGVPASIDLDKSKPQEALRLNIVENFFIDDIRNRFGNAVSPALLQEIQQDLANFCVYGNAPDYVTQRSNANQVEDMRKFMVFTELLQSESPPQSLRLRDRQKLSAEALASGESTLGTEIRQGIARMISPENIPQFSEQQQARFSDYSEEVIMNYARSLAKNNSNLQAGATITAGN